MKCIITVQKPLNHRHQKGVATLLFSVVILGLVTITAVYTSKAILVEQRMTNNDTRSKLAFENAEAAMAVAMQYASGGLDRTTNGTADGIADGLPDPVFDTNNDGFGDTNTADIGTGSATVNITQQAVNTYEITAQGFSDDNSATRSIVQWITSLDPLPNEPDIPMITKGTVVITGSATVHNPEGHSTVWSGGNVDLGSNNATATQVADVTDVNYPACMDTSMTCNVMDSSNKVTVGLDVIEYDSSLANLDNIAFFQNFFGLSPQAYRESRVTLEVAAANVNSSAAADPPGVNLATNQVIWIEGDAQFQNKTTVGCKSIVPGAGVCSASDLDPSILIVNGNATFNGTPKFYGLIFVNGNINISGNTTIYGSIVAAGATNNMTSGSLDVWFRSDVLGPLAPTGNFTAHSGSWRDF